MLRLRDIMTAETMTTCSIGALFTTTERDHGSEGR